MRIAASLSVLVAVTSVVVAAPGALRDFQKRYDHHHHHHHPQSEEYTHHGGEYTDEYVPPDYETTTTYDEEEPPTYVEPTPGYIETTYDEYHHEKYPTETYPETYPDTYEEEKYPDTYEEEKYPTTYEEEKYPTTYEEEKYPDTYTEEEEYPSTYTEEEEYPSTYEEETYPSTYEEETYPETYPEEYPEETTYPETYEEETYPETYTEEETYPEEHHHDYEHHHHHHHEEETYPEEHHHDYEHHHEHHHHDYEHHHEHHEYPEEEHHHEHHHGHHEYISIQPEYMVQIKECEPDHAYGKTDWGLISRTNGAKNVYTLASFWVPPEYKGCQCKLVFYQVHDISGSMEGQIYSVIGHIPEDATFNKKPARNIHVATFKTDWTMAYGHAHFTYYGGEYFDCPGDQTLGYELVPVGDNDYIEWQQEYGFAIHVKY